jgi:hypothetical protein
MRQPYDIDHIDPTWVEGRGYQLICGLDVELNLLARDVSLNCSKSNRFLPWRVVSEELGSAPVHEGDFCQFLDPDSGEWVLEEFLGEWWFQQTRKVFGGYLGGTRTRDEGTGLHAPGVRSRAGSIGGKFPWWTNLTSGKSVRSWESPGPDWVANTRVISWNPHKNKSSEEIFEHAKYMNSQIRPESLSNGGKSTGNSKWMCLETGYITNAPALASYHKREGIDKSRRVKLTPEEVAFIYLWDTNSK